MEVGARDSSACPVCGGPDVSVCRCPDPQALISFLSAFNRAAVEPPPPVEPRPGRARAAARRRAAGPDAEETGLDSETAGLGDPEADWTCDAPSVAPPVWPPPPETALVNSDLGGAEPQRATWVRPSTPDRSAQQGDAEVPAGSGRRRLLRRSRL